MGDECSLNYGRWLSSPPPGEDIVISGISGAFPESENVNEFRDNLYKKVDMVTVDTRRWAITHPEIPERSGKIPNVEKFDAGFFGLHYRQGQSMDPLVRLMLEKSVEALFDAGINPSELEGTNTGVFIGSSFSETESRLVGSNLESQHFEVTGTTRSMISHRVSYHLKLKGQSHNVDTACSSSLFALEQAYRAIRNGRCDQAIVGGINVNLHPYVTLQFARLGVLSREGKCKVFDVNSDGYVRSESVGVLILQKSKHARRNYAHVLHAQANCDGFKPQGINFPSRQLQTSLLSSFYKECNVDPKDLSYMEAHGTATLVGDPEEVAALDEIFCKNRTQPLLVGSVKSNVGHSEPSSGITSVVKAIITMENGKVPPNLHYTKPRKGVEALEEGRIKVVTETTPLTDTRGIIAVSSFGFGGANSHILLRWNQKEKSKNGLSDNLPRLVVISGRTLSSVTDTLNDVKHNLNFEQISLYHKVFKKPVDGHLFRGYSLVTSSREIERSQIKLVKEKQLCLVFSGFKNASVELIKNFYNIPRLKGFIERILDTLDVYNIGTKEDFLNNGGVGRDLINGITQILFIDVLKEIGLKPVKSIVRKHNEIFHKYYLGEITLKELLPKISNSCKHHTNGFNGYENELYNSKFLHLELGDSISSSGFTFKNVTGNDYFSSFLQLLGRLYVEGFNFEIDKLYPEVKFPVSRGTPMISPAIKWQHDKKWKVLYYVPSSIMDNGERVVKIQPSDDAWSYVTGHVVDGRNLFPATAYLYCVWEALAFKTNTITANMKVTFEDCRFQRACFVSQDRPLQLTIMIQKGTGNFEVIESETLVVSGRIYVSDGYKRVKFDNCSKKKTTLPMSSRDIYKELSLRGYNYRGEFKNVKTMSGDLEEGSIHWNGNWVTFLDNMLQLKILQLDTRLLYVPIGMKSLSIDAPKHISFAQQYSEDSDLPVYIHKSNDVVESGGIEIRGFQGGTIPTRKYTDDPVLEKYVFIPNEAQLSLEESVRVNVQILLENSTGVKIKVVENLNSEGFEPLSPHIHKALSDQPLIQPEVKLLTKKVFEFPGVAIGDGKLLGEIDCNLVVGFGLLKNLKDLNAAFNSVSKNGFVLSREGKNFEFSQNDNVVILTIHSSEEERFFLICRPFKQEQVTLDVSDEENFTWLPELKEIVKNDQNVVVFSQNKPTSGILGLFNCLKHEIGLNKIQCFFLKSEAPPFNPSLPFYQTQINKNLVVNVFENSQWGTYRHLLLKTGDVLSEHAFVNCLTTGDLSSLRWIEGPIKSEYLKSKDSLIHIYYASLNFRDVVLASGRIGVDASSPDRRHQQFPIGIEFCGLTANGQRVMGMNAGGSLSNLTKIGKETFSWPIPDSWSFEDAATVPVVYGTILYALFMRSKLRPGNSILIHAGSGGIGLASITLALNYGCAVFTTVSTKEKQQYLLDKFPGLKKDHIGNSRDCSFEEMIYKQTNGNGVDFVINSLAEEKLLASVNCLARGGTFLEIGKFDITQNNNLSMLLLRKGGSFHGIMLDHFMRESDDASKQELCDLMENAISKGLVEPLPRIVYDSSEIEAAFRFMGSGGHKGKVLIKIRDQSETMKCLPSHFCNPHKTYVIVGGLGGFGLELADWLVLRGATRLVLTSRKGIKTGYQSFRINIWESYGTIVKVLTEDVTTRSGCEKMLQKAKEIGEIEAIFNLAVLLKDATLENQTEESFRDSFGAKAYATKYLDEHSRSLCQTLKYFVVFSSVSCGRGNSGQSNYGMANSVMERICEKRKRDGYPALAVQWGVIGDVGIVAEAQEDSIEMQIGGTLTQPIKNCLEVLDSFLRQDQPIVASMVVAKKQTSGFDGNLVENVSQILGIKDLKTVSMHTPLSELGMDSITVLEIKQRLEAKFQVYLGLQEIRKITFARLHEMQEDLESSKNETTLNQASKGLDVFVRMVSKEQTDLSPVKHLKTKKTKTLDKPDAIIFPSIEGIALILEPLTKNLNFSASCLQFTHDKSINSIEDIATQVLNNVEQLTGKNFKIVAYSFGTLVALEVISLLERRGYSGHLICIDGAPKLFSDLVITQVGLESEALFETGVLSHLAAFVVPPEAIHEKKEQILNCKTLEERLGVIEAILPNHEDYSKERMRDDLEIMCRRIIAVKNYKPNYKLKSKITLYKPSNESMPGSANDYELSALTEGEVDVKVIDGNHLTMIENLELAEEINKLFANSS